MSFCCNEDAWERAVSTSAARIVSFSARGFRSLSFPREEQLSALKRRLEHLEDSNERSSSLAHAAALKEAKLGAELEGCQRESAAGKLRVLELEGLLEGMHSSARIHGEEADTAIAALKVGISTLKEARSTPNSHKKKCFLSLPLFVLHFNPLCLFFFISFLGLVWSDKQFEISSDFSF
jgi:hypothetical protein